jgi:hypothetical protein
MFLDRKQRHESIFSKEKSFSASWGREREKRETRPSSCPLSSSFFLPLLFGASSHSLQTLWLTLLFVLYKKFSFPLAWASHVYTRKKTSPAREFVDHYFTLPLRTLRLDFLFLGQTRKKTVSCFYLSFYWRLTTEGTVHWRHFPFRLLLLCMS